MNPTALTRSYYPSLDGLRGIAILLVICCHNFNFVPFLNFGWVGVDLFFVLSGFLITDILLQTRETKNFLPNFYIRRALRIFPLFYIMLLLFFVIVPFIAQFHEQYKYYHDNQEMTWFHLINWLYIFQERPNHNLLLNHFWSLSLEEQFYFIWPFLILLFKNLRWLSRAIIFILVICIASRIISWSYWGGNYTGFCFHNMTRLDGLCIGSLIAIWRFQDIRTLRKKFFRFFVTVLGIHLIALLLAKTFFPGLPHFVFFGYTSICAIFGAIVFHAISKSAAATKFLLENKLLKYFGKISYGLYVFHWPVFIFFKLFVLNKLTTRGINYTYAEFIVATSAFVMATLLSILSYTYFEKRILALKDVMTEQGFFGRVRQKLLLLMRPASAK
jgi:peptidoglycan/LPS O-acetylase OafA/YrhL